MNNYIPSNINIILEKIKKIDNTSDLLTEIFNDNINHIQEPNFKYFILTIFFQKNPQLPIDDIWMLFKVLVSVNQNIIKEKKEFNELYVLCLKNCVNLLLNSLTNINIEKNYGFKNNEISVLFDFLFSLPLIKHFINLVESEKQKKEIIELLNQIGTLILDKVKVTKNNIFKNIFNNFNHFLNINEINSIINKEDKKSSKSKNKKKNDNKIDKTNQNRITFINNENINSLNVNNLSHKEFNSFQNNILINSNCNNSFCNGKQIPLKSLEKQKKNSIKIRKEKSNEYKYSLKNNEGNNINNMKMNISLPTTIPLINKKNVIEEIKIFKKYIKELVDKVNSFINLDEMKKSIKEKLPGNILFQIGSFLYTTPYPDPTNINVDLLIQKQNNGNYNIKKYFDTFETFKNISNIKCSFFCLNKDQYFYDCLEKNKSFFHLTRTDMDESSILSIYNFKTVTVHLYAYNMVYGYSSFFIKKLYSTLKNLWQLHLFYEIILLKEFPVLKSNYELSLLILNFLQINYKVFSEKCEDKKFTYFAYDKSKNYGYLTNFPLVMQYKTLYFFEFDDDRICFIKQKNVVELAKEFHKFLCRYFEYIYNDGKLFDNYRNEMNISRDNYFLDIKYIFNRHFLDQNLICYKNNSTDEFVKIKKLFSSLCFE